MAAGDEKTGTVLYGNASRKAPTRLGGAPMISKR